MPGIGSIESRLRRLEELCGKIMGLLNNALHKLGQVAEDNSRDARPLPNSGGGSRYAVITTDVGTRSGTTLGMGAGQLQKTTYDPSTDVGTNADDDGDPVAIYSGDAANSVTAGSLVMVIPVGGRLNIVVDYCAGG